MNISIYLPRDLLKELRQRAIAEHRSLSNLIQAMLLQQKPIKKEWKRAQ
jgi:CopG-like RHH_1 or ribbon-helix-helix domain, RHH_5